MPVAMSPRVEEFYNRCHGGSDGKFCGTGGGNKAGRTAAQRAAAAKVSKQKVGSSGSKIVGKSDAKSDSAPAKAHGKGPITSKPAKSRTENEIDRLTGIRNAERAGKPKGPITSKPTPSKQASEIDRLTKKVEGERAAAKKSKVESAGPAKTHGKSDAPAKKSEPSLARKAGREVGAIKKEARNFVRGLKKEVSDKVATAMAKADGKPKQKVPASKRVMNFLEKASKLSERMDNIADKSPTAKYDSWKERSARKSRQENRAWEKKNKGPWD